jgi:hypothetical protein
MPTNPQFAVSFNKFCDEPRNPAHSVCWAVQVRQRRRTPIGSALVTVQVSQEYNSAHALRSSAARCFRSATAAADRWPTFHRAWRQRSRPSAVRGPVDAPPCIRQRVYFPVLALRIAGALHAVPLRVLAPHRGAFDGSPLGLPCNRRPEFLLLAMLSTSKPMGRMKPPSS